jgi:hypothetical protein
MLHCKMFTFFQCHKNCSFLIYDPNIYHPLICSPEQLITAKYNILKCEYKSFIVLFYFKNYYIFPIIMS